MMAAQSDEQLGATDEPDPAGFAAEEKADPALWDRNGTHVDILQFSVFPQQLFIKSFFFFFGLLYNSVYLIQLGRAISHQSRVQSSAINHRVTSAIIHTL
jgi:hypothetical protein